MLSQGEVVTPRKTQMFRKQTSMHLCGQARKTASKAGLHPKEMHRGAQGPHQGDRGPVPGEAGLRGPSYSFVLGASQRPGALWGLQCLRPHPRSPEPESAFSPAPRAGDAACLGVW